MSRQNKQKRNKAISTSFSKGKKGPASTTPKRTNIRRVVKSDKDVILSLNSYRKDLKMNPIGSFAEFKTESTIA